MNENTEQHPSTWPGQVRMFNVHIQSKLLQHTPVTGTGTGLRRFLCPEQEKKMEYEQSDQNR